MGCPKAFSLKGGMGAALLTQPQQVEKILTTLVNGISKPVTCKIRVLPRLESTLELCKIIEKTGVSALTVHGRTVDERDQHPNRHDVIKIITESLSIPVIANGGSGNIETANDIENFKKLTGCSSVMIARAAEKNCSVFRKEGVLSKEEVIKSYLKYAIEYDNHPLNTKFCIQQILQDDQQSDQGRLLLAEKTLKGICKIWDMEADLTEALERRSNIIANINNTKADGFPNKKLKVDETVERDYEYLRFQYKDRNLPKLCLYDYARKQRLPNPVFQTENSNKLFKSIVTFNGLKYTNSICQRNKKSAEQAAALVVLKELGYQFANES
ncbi:tRNA-dihydrouridine(20) synthase [NAD(P)+]-like, variant 2 [Chamberlinius hualienensis]